MGRCRGGKKCERSREVTWGPRLVVSARSLRIDDSAVRDSRLRTPRSLKFPQTFVKRLPETPGLRPHCRRQPAERGAPAREFWRRVWQEGSGRAVLGRRSEGVERGGNQPKQNFSDLVVQPGPPPNAGWGGTAQKKVEDDVWGTACCLCALEGKTRHTAELCLALTLARGARLWVRGLERALRSQT